VTFYDGTTVIGTATLSSSGTATIGVTSLPVGTDAITATYAGSVSFGSSTSAVLYQDVNRAAVSVTIPVALSTFVVQVRPESGTPALQPTGTVTVYAAVLDTGDRSLRSLHIVEITGTLVDVNGVSEFTGSVPSGTSVAGFVIAYYHGDGNYLPGGG